MFSQVKDRWDFWLVLTRHFSHDIVFCTVPPKTRITAGCFSFFQKVFPWMTLFIWNTLWCGRSGCANTSVQWERWCYNVDLNKNRHPTRTRVSSLFLRSRWSRTPSTHEERCRWRHLHSSKTKIICLDSVSKNIGFGNPREPLKIFL